MKIFAVRVGLTIQRDIAGEQAPNPILGDNEKMEFHQQVTVGQDGRIILQIPDATEGDVADVTVHLSHPRVKRVSGFGSRKGQIQIPDDYKKPLEDFEAYS